MRHRKSLHMTEQVKLGKSSFTILRSRSKIHLKSCYLWKTLLLFKRRQIRARAANYFWPQQKDLMPLLRNLFFYRFKELPKSATFQFLFCVTIGDSPITIGSACFSHGSNVGIFCELKLATWTEVKPERKYAIRKRTILKTLIHWALQTWQCLETHISHIYISPTCIHSCS